jgi:hypothetical protein
MPAHLLLKELVHVITIGLSSVKITARRSSILVEVFILLPVLSGKCRDGTVAAATPSSEAGRN